MNEIQDLIFHDKKLFVVYILVSYDEVLYVGRSTDFYGRLYKHLTHKDSKVKDKGITHIRLFFCDTKSDMDLTENYFIKKYQPTHNERLKDQDKLSFDLSQIEEQNNIRIELDELLEFWRFIKYTYKLCMPDEYKKYKNRWRNF